MRDGSTISVDGLGSDVRRRRLELGLSQSRLAETIGVPPTQIGRWERGDGRPTEQQIRSLALALGLDADEASAWAGVPEAPLLAVEIISEPSITIGDGPALLAPPIAGAAADPWGLRSAEPAAASGLIASPSAADGSSGRVVPPEARLSSTERTLRRRARLDERRIKRELTAASRAARELATSRARQRREMEAAALRRGTLPMLEPGFAPAPPAGAANTGSVFPVPDTRHSSERVTYRSQTPMSPRKEKARYSSRIVLTVAILVTMAGLLLWALGALGDGLGAVLDLVRSGGEPEVGSSAFRMPFMGRIG